MNFERILLSVSRIALKGSVEERQMLTKAHSNHCKEPILQDIQCFLSSTEHSQLTALTTLQNLALDFRCQPSYEQESQHKNKRNSTILSQFLVSCSWIRQADTVIESTASVLIRPLMYSTKYKELFTVIDAAKERVPMGHCRYFYFIAGHNGQIEHPTALS